MSDLAALLRALEALLAEGGISSGEYEERKAGLIAAHPVDGDDTARP